MISIEYLKYSICKTWLVLGLLFISFYTFAQDTAVATTVMISDSSSSVDSEKDFFEKERNHALTATLLSTALPGAGQIYNKRYWKVPIIYGLGGYIIYTIDVYQHNYKLYQESLYHLQEKAEFGFSDTPYHIGDDTTASEYTLRQKKQEFRKKRDRSILYLTLLYALNIVDANVDAHLKGFQVRQGMIMTFRPEQFDDKILMSVTLTF